MNKKIFAGIDIGSNAIRLLIEEINGEQKTNVDFKKLAYLRVPIRLGEDVFTKGEISDNKRQLLCYALQGFSSIMKAYNVQNYRACATSAMRDAQNGAQITQVILETSGIELDIISGQEEADMIYSGGALGNVMNRERNYLYVDVGGGSTEIVVYSNRQKVDSNSFQMGTVRMLVDAVADDEKDKMKDWLKEIYKPNAPLSIIGSGGNINKIFKLLKKREGECITYAELKVLHDRLTELTFDERIQVFKLNEYRADVIIPALNIFLTIAKACKVNEIFVPKVGLVDGIVRQLYNQSI